MSATEDRKLALSKAPEMALSGHYGSADDIVRALAPEIRNVHAIFSPDVRAYLDELCRSSRAAKR